MLHWVRAPSLQNLEPCSSFSCSGPNLGQARISDHTIFIIRLFPAKPDSPIVKIAHQTAQLWKLHKKSILQPFWPFWSLLFQMLVLTTWQFPGHEMAPCDSISYILYHLHFTQNQTRQFYKIITKNPFWTQRREKMLALFCFDVFKFFEVSDIFKWFTKNHNLMN